MSTLATLEQELAERQDDLNTCNEMLALDPGSADALETIPVLEETIADLKAKIATKKAEQSIPPPPADDDAPPPPKTRSNASPAMSSIGFLVRFDRRARVTTRKKLTGFFR